MHEEVKLDLARLFFKTTLAIFVIATISVVIFWVCAVLMVAGYLDVHSISEFIQVLQARICITH